MKSILSWILLVLVAATAGGYWWWSKSTATSTAGFRFGKVERGPLNAAVSSTGTLRAVVQVQVGSQISGQIKELLADFNTRVKKDQVIARLDPESFELRVRQALADVEAARATLLTQQAAIGAQRASVSREEVNLAEAERDYERKQQLFEKEFIAQAERDKARAVFNVTQEQVKSARAQVAVSEAQAKNAEALVKQREAQLAQARVDLERTIIRSPVDGIVIRRSVDAGQTVAASLQAPELFVIAQNLADMQVEASVDEADVGRIRTGQAATFTVDSFPSRTFNGEVTQVRTAAQVVQNVVTYTVVISAANPDLQLLPGMTANVRVVTERRADALKVPNAALRYRPPAALVGSAPSPAGGAAANSTDETQPAKGGAGKAAAFQRRIVSELKLDENQQQKLDAIMEAQRGQLSGLAGMPPAERAKAAQSARAGLAARIAEILTYEQKPRLAELMGGAGTQASQGRIHIQADDGRLKAVELRLGITDGAMTEVLGGPLKAGEQVVIGQAGAARAPSPAGKGPGFGF